MTEVKLIWGKMKGLWVASSAGVNWHHSLHLPVTSMVHTTEPVGEKKNRAAKFFPVPSTTLWNNPPWEEFQFFAKLQRSGFY